MAVAEDLVDVVEEDFGVLEVAVVVEVVLEVGAAVEVAVLEVGVVGASEEEVVRSFDQVHISIRPFRSLVNESK